VIYELLNNICLHWSKPSPPTKITCLQTHTKY